MYLTGGQSLIKLIEISNFPRDYFASKSKEFSRGADTPPFLCMTCRKWQPKTENVNKMEQLTSSSQHWMRPAFFFFFKKMNQKKNASENQLFHLIFIYCLHFLFLVAHASFARDVTNWPVTIELNFQFSMTENLLKNTTLTLRSIKNY